MNNKQRAIELAKTLLALLPFAAIVATNSLGLCALSPHTSTLVCGNVPAQLFVGHLLPVKFSRQIGNQRFPGGSIELADYPRLDYTHIVHHAAFATDVGCY